MLPRPRGPRAGASALLALLVAVVAPAPATAQEGMQIDGVIQSIAGQTLVLLSTTPINRGRATIGPNLMPVPAPRALLDVDLDQVPASQYVFLRPGERIAVNGRPSPDGRRFVATSIVGGTGPQTPQAP
jgi:hypothetical protein